MGASRLLKSSLLPIFASLFLSFLAPGALADWKVLPSKDKINYYVIRVTSASGKKDNRIAWLRQDVLQGVVESKSIVKLADRADQGALLDDLFNRGIVRLASTTEKAYRLNEAVQKEWLALRSSSGTRSCKYVASSTGEEMAPLISAEGFDIDAPNPEARQMFVSAQCEKMAGAYKTAGGPDQVCYGEILCNGGKTPKFCACGVTEKISKGNPLSGRCPTAFDCLKECESGQTPLGHTILRDSAQGSSEESKHPDFARDLSIESKSPPLRIGPPGGGQCLYDEATINGESDQLTCPTAHEHCPPPKACSELPCTFNFFAMFAPKPR